MATIVEGIFKGKVGDIVYYTYKGKPCARRKAEKITFSEKMREQSERVASIGALHRAMKEEGLDEIWTKEARGIGLNGYNLLVRENSPAFSGEGRVTDFRKLRLTIGKVRLPDHLQLTEGEEGEIVLTWENNAGAYPLTHDGDILVFALMKEGRSFRIRFPEIGDWQRKHCRALIRLPPAWKEFHHFYCFFYSVEDDEFSDSIYFNIN